jgi:thiamine biosynthesis lipoprotein
VVTAGDYQRYVIGLDGKRYHHILNPVSGYPAQSGLISVTIVSRDAIVADVLSTAILIAGEEKGLEIIAGFPGTEAILVNQSQEILITQGLKDFQSNERFIVV